MYQNFDFGDLNHRLIYIHFTQKPRSKQALSLQKFFSLPIWDLLLTRLPYCKLSSRIVDRHMLASEGGDHE